MYRTKNLKNKWLSRNLINTFLNFVAKKLKKKLNLSIKIINFEFNLKNIIPVKKIVWNASQQETLVNSL